VNRLVHEDVAKRELVLALGERLLGIGVVLVEDLAHDLLDEVLHRDDARGAAELVEHEHALPRLPGPKPEGAEATEVLQRFWRVKDKFDFENVGFTKTVDGNLKYLICGECDVGPIGYYDLRDEASIYVACERVSSAPPVGVTRAALSDDAAAELEAEAQALGMDVLAEAHDAVILECLAQVLPHAGKMGVKLALENREHYEAAPLDRQFEIFLKRLDSPHAGYWHDFGHAQIKHNLGLLDHAQLLKRMAPHLLGCHIHDTRWPFRDHCPPFTGDTPLDELVPLLPKSCATVFEIAPRTEAADIQKAAVEWRRRHG
jgi:hypothetical protein